jgi:esterase/lipase superfamily enzyme
VEIALIKLFSLALLASGIATTISAQDFEPEAFGTISPGLEGMVVQDFLVPQIELAPEIFPAFPVNPSLDADLTTGLQSFSEDELYYLSRDPILVGNTLLSNAIQTQTDTPLTSALAEASRGAYDPSVAQLSMLLSSVKLNGTQAQISDFMGLTATLVDDRAFTFNFDPSSNVIIQKFAPGEQLVLPIEQAPLNAIVQATSVEPSVQARQVYQFYQRSPARGDQALEYLKSPNLPNAVGTAAIETAFDLGDSDFLRAMLSSDMSLLDGSFAGLDVTDLKALAENSTQTPAMQVVLGDLYLQNGDPTEALLAFSSVPGKALQAEQALGRQALASFYAPGDLNALEPLRAEQLLLDKVLSGDTYASATVLRDLNQFPSSITLAAATTLRASPASAEQLTSARQAQTEGCGAADASPDAWCTAFDIVYVTTRQAIESDGDILFGSGVGPLASGIIRTRLPVAFELAMAQEPTLSALGCTLGRLTCPRALEQLVNEAETPSLPAEAPQRVDDFDATLTDALAHFSPPEDAPPRALIFIHGFNTDFAEATDAVARLMITARYPSTPYLFSWPSQGRTLFSRQRSVHAVSGERTRNAYQADRNAVTASCTEMRDAMRDIIRRYGSGQVDIVAHSMGNQLLWEMLQGCGDFSASALTDAEGKPFRAMILVAADLSLLKFRDNLATYTDVADELAIYASPNDIVLQASARVFNQNTLGDGYNERVPRLGLYTLSTHAFEGEVQVISTQTVDGTTTYAPRNHSYHINNPTVRRDISMIMNGQFSQLAIRCILGPMVGGHYMISPNCL